MLKEVSDLTLAEKSLTMEVALLKFAVIKKFYNPLHNNLSNLHFKLHPYFYVLTKVFQEF